MADLRVTGRLPEELLTSTRALLDRAFDGDFTDEDWEHALGGVHATLVDDDVVVAHAAVVPRDIRIDGRWFRAGYVEAVAAHPDLHGKGLGSQVVDAIVDIIRDRDEVGVLSTGAQPFYERLGWERWRGSSAVLDEGGPRRTPEDDDSLMVLRTKHSATLALDGEIACESRPGDDW
ncbi:MAG: GNAT family N-acetyltransferase [Acidimicrobiales bacterium]|nr:GNAT family N-acetyltransferase [Acidimicrobiales bacterium]